MYKPNKDEYNPYYEVYVSTVPGDDIIPVLAAQPGELREILEDVADARGTYAYAEGKWTIKELLSHLIDGERIFAYRMLRISRGDMTPIEGFEQDDYIFNSNANNRTFADLFDEFEYARRSNVLMLKNMDETALKRVGTASDNRISVRALAYISAGHVRHHLRILSDRYLA